ncbi:MAG TPA: hypothetical protein VLZ03_00920 [Thermodesulfobacteriota bacterium]|nr:hypothetical protein [Thermodesulfobacteriota bacterium]
MSVKKALYFTSILVAIVILLPYSGWTQLFPYLGGRQPRPGVRPPIITHAFAVEKGYYGYIWKIYIEADDPDGEMLRIASVVNEVGVGWYPTDWIYLKHKYAKHFAGYIQWNTFSSATSYLPEWTQISVKVSVIDRSGNESNEVVFPFTFEITPQAYAYKLPVPFDEGKLPMLGHIMVDLTYPGQGYGRYGGGDFR